MNVRITHRLVFDGRDFTFVVDTECPFTPTVDFLFVFRGENGRDDCALIVEEIYGWDATNQTLLVRSREWNIDDWVLNDEDDRRNAFDDARQQLINVVGCSKLEE